MRFAYTRFEIMRVVRNPRFLMFSFAFPLVLFLAIAGPQRHDQSFGGSGIPAVLFYLVSLTTWGAMGAMMNGGGRIAAERAVGWNRQLRITPLSPIDYLRGKVVVSYLMALATFVVLLIAALALGAHVAGGRLLEMLLYLAIGLIPFCLLGIALGHILTPDTIGPAIGGVVGLLPLVSGIWTPLPEHGFLHVLGEALPSYWLVQASHLLIVPGDPWGQRGWITIAIWTVVMLRVARRAYQRDTARQ